VHTSSSLPLRLMAAVVLAVVALMLTFSAGAGAEEVFEGCPAPPSEAHTIFSDEPIINGTAAGDWICAGRSANLIIGGLLDDHIYGGGGDDIIIGGHGADIIDGGLGNDWIRGGDGPDCFEGGTQEEARYTDTVSFADMTPNEGGTTAGVIADLSARDETIGEIRPSCGGTAGTGRALGQGYNEELNHIDNIVGSAFDDDITAASSAATRIEAGLGDDSLHGTGANDTLKGEYGADTCTNDGTATECADGGGEHRPSEAFAYAENREEKDYGLVVMGAEGTHDDALEVRRPNETQLTATASEALTPLGPSCSASEAHAVNCALSAARYVVVWGDSGNDSLSVGSGLTVGRGSIDLNGGPGNDTLTGNSAEDLLFSGLGGQDTLSGDGGEDALISEGDPREGELFGTGGDSLDGGEGDDQLATDNACAGHTFIGGRGTDVIGFARQTTIGGVPAGVTAVLGEGERNGVAVAVKDTGGSFAGCRESTTVPGSETLEGTNHHDYLQGNEAPNTIWGRKGNDLILAVGGADIVRGHEGDDEIWNGTGSDDVQGGEGNDGIYAESGNDTIDGQGGNDELRGGEGDDTINGGTGIDRLQGFAGNDILHGGDGEDSIIGYEGVDALYGEAGTDTLYPRDGIADSAVNCGEGADIPVEADRVDPVDRSCERR
jgi:Ca2+-binding RTX toxin-like protein